MFLMRPYVIKQHRNQTLLGLKICETRLQAIKLFHLISYICVVLCFGVLLQVGDKLPNVDLFEGSPGSKVNAAELFAGKKGVLFAVPGAFTPGCSKVHMHRIGFFYVHLC